MKDRKDICRTMEISREKFEVEMEQIFDEVGMVIGKASELVTDSLQYVMLIAAIEDAYSVVLPDEFLAFSNIQNVDVFLDCVYDVVSGKS